ncbi:MAG: hypothetical protein ACPG52_00995 [Cognaticolwellia sp.]
MFYLYLGYVLAQSYSVIEKIALSNISILAIFFSMVVFFIWSILPVTGYLVAQFFKGKGQLPNKVLFVSGVSLGVIENLLFHFNFLVYGQETLGTCLIFFLSFVLAWLPYRQSTSAA